MARRDPPLVPEFLFSCLQPRSQPGEIFIEPQNYAFFLRRLRKHIAGSHADVVAYVLMPNHYHLLMRILSDDFSNAMRNFTISYVKAINHRYSHRGRFFKGLFKRGM